MYDKITRCPRCQLFFTVTIDERRKLPQSWTCRLCKGYKVEDKKKLIRKSIRIHKRRTDMGFNLGKQSFRHKEYETV